MNVGKILGLLGGVASCVIGAIGISDGAKSIRGAFNKDEHSGRYPWGETEKEEDDTNEEEIVIEKEETEEG